MFTGHVKEIVYEHFWVGSREGKRQDENSRTLERAKEIYKKWCVQGVHLFNKSSLKGSHSVRKLSEVNNG